MAKAPKSPPSEEGDEMWVRPTTTIKQEGSGEINRNIGGTANTSRFLELADIALGFKKPQLKKRGAAAGSGATHQTSAKTEPYSP
jgi:hypothetical protein